MKQIRTLLTALLIAAPLATSIAQAQEAATPETTPPQRPLRKGMGRMTEEMDKHLEMRQEHMLKMHDLSNRILSATDEAERERLKKEQRQLMREHMQTRRGVRGGRQDGEDTPAADE